MTYAVHHRVRDYERWKEVFDGHEDVRRSYGQIEHRIYHAWAIHYTRRPQRLPKRRGGRVLRQRSEPARRDGREESKASPASASPRSRNGSRTSRRPDGEQMASDWWSKYAWLDEPSLNDDLMAGCVGVVLEWTRLGWRGASELTRDRVARRRSTRHGSCPNQTSARSRPDLLDR